MSTFIMLDLIISLSISIIVVALMMKYCLYFLFGVNAYSVNEYTIVVLILCSVYAKAAMILNVFS